MNTADPVSDRECLFSRLQLDGEDSVHGMSCIWVSRKGGGVTTLLQCGVNDVRNLFTNRKHFLVEFFTRTQSYSVM